MSKPPKPSSGRENFFEDVCEVVKLIPAGKVSTYGAIAQYLGAKRSARMVGYALNGSAIADGIPAHRVVNRRGELSGRHHFSSDYPMAQRLEDEGIEVKSFQIVDFETHFLGSQPGIIVSTEVKQNNTFIISRLINTHIGIEIEWIK